jgi:type III pantothenate kinase
LLFKPECGIIDTNQTGGTLAACGKQKEDMILALDVGNSNIVIGCIDETKIHFISRLTTDTGKTVDEYAISFKNILELYQVDLDQIDGAIISSVVPPLNLVLREAVYLAIRHTPLIVGPGVKTGLNIMIDNPGQLGSDLVVDAVAAIQLYEKPLIIFDMGTATTASVVDKAGNYRGGMIIPGVRVSLDALTSRTAQLPRISMEAPKKVIGMNTIDCMKSGTMYGTAAMLDGIIDRIEEEIGSKATVVATGGLAKFIVPLCKKQIICDDDLLLKGLWYIYRKNQKSRTKTKS